MIIEKLITGGPNSGNMGYEELIFRAIRMTRIPYLFREFIQKRRVTIVLYHDLDPQLADNHFSVLKKLYNVISLDDYVNARKSGRMNQLPPKSLIITFDDGHKSNFLLGPVIKKHKIPASIFLCSGIIDTNQQFWWNCPQLDHDDIQKLKECSDVERIKLLALQGYKAQTESADREALSHEEIMKMASGGLVNFQSHTVTHVCLPRCSNEKAALEIFDSKRNLENDYGFRISSLSFPNGDYSDRDIELVKSAGYECAITVDPGFNDGSSDLFALKRFCLSDSCNTDELIVKASGFWGFLRAIVSGQSYGYQEANERS